MHNDMTAARGDGKPAPSIHFNTLFYDSHPIRWALINGQHWYVAADVCRAVGVYNDRHGAAKYVRAVPYGHKLLYRLAGISRGSPSLLIVTDIGLDKLLWLALHSVSKAWNVIASINVQTAASLEAPDVR